MAFAFTTAAINWPLLHSAIQLRHCAQVPIGALIFAGNHHWPLTGQQDLQCRTCVAFLLRQPTSALFQLSLHSAKVYDPFECILHSRISQCTIITVLIAIHIDAISCQIVHVQQLTDSRVDLRCASSGDEIWENRTKLPHNDRDCLCLPVQRYDLT